MYPLQRFFYKNFYHQDLSLNFNGFITYNFKILKCFSFKKKDFKVLYGLVRLETAIWFFLQKLTITRINKKDNK